MGITLNIGDRGSFSFGADRVSHMLNANNRQAATQMGWVDKVLDFFRGGKKAEALNLLYDFMEEGGLGSFFRFDLLSRLADPGDRPLFSIHVKPHGFEADAFMVQYSINAILLKSEIINTAQAEKINAFLGNPVDASVISQAVRTINGYKLTNEVLIPQQTDNDFSAGGVHKQYNPGAGLLRAQSHTGIEDFDREALVDVRMARHPELGYYVSTQTRIDRPAHLSGDYVYATVDIFDKEKVASAEMIEYFDEHNPASLNLDQAKSLLVQLVDMARVFYKSKVAHRDLHMKNLIVHRVKETNSVHLKAIDFGKLKIGPSFEKSRYSDIDYLFNKEGVGLVETVGRNHLRSERSDRMKKHYPIHKLFDRFNARGVPMDAVLARVGANLKADLMHAGDNDDMVDRAFERASNELQLMFFQVRSSNHAMVAYV